jgi:hypothetical protein
MDAKKAIDGHGEPWEAIVEDKELFFQSMVLILLMSLL